MFANAHNETFAPFPNLKPRNADRNSSRSPTAKNLSGDICIHVYIYIYIYTYMHIYTHRCARAQVCPSPVRLRASKPVHLADTDAQPMALMQRAAARGSGQVPDSGWPHPRSARLLIPTISCKLHSQVGAATQSRRVPLSRYRRVSLGAQLSLQVLCALTGLRPS